MLVEPANSCRRILDHVHQLGVNAFRCYGEVVGRYPQRRRPHAVEPLGVLEHGLIPPRLHVLQDLPDTPLNLGVERAEASKNPLQRAMAIVEINELDQLLGHILVAVSAAIDPRSTSRVPPCDTSCRLL